MLPKKLKRKKEIKEEDKVLTSLQRGAYYKWQGVSAKPFSQAGMSCWPQELLSSSLHNHCHESWRWTWYVSPGVWGLHTHSWGQLPTFGLQNSRSEKQANTPHNGTRRKSLCFLCLQGPSAKVDFTGPSWKNLLSRAIWVRRLIIKGWKDGLQEAVNEWGLWGPPGEPLKNPQILSTRENQHLYFQSSNHHSTLFIFYLGLNTVWDFIISPI